MVVECEKGKERVEGIEDRVSEKGTVKICNNNELCRVDEWLKR